jgi:hypothetical protein
LLAVVVITASWCKIINKYIFAREAIIGPEKFLMLLPNEKEISRERNFSQIGKSLLGNELPFGA